MKKIAIKPHKTRGIELIKILERMGGYNSHHLDGFSFRDDTAYLINENGIITSYTEHLCHEKGYKIYTLEEWEDEYKSDKMIEGLVEEERVSNVNSITQDRVDKLACKIDEELPSGNPYEWECPEGYQFVDENGNVINAKTIVLEKKSPKTDDIIKWLREHDMTKYIGVICSGMCFITFDTEELIKDITEMIGDE